jgi:hypothetical protein
MPGTASADHFVCSDVRPGDTAAHLALRLTNNPEARHQAWFQIIDPARSRFVSKSSYDLILPGWRVCLAAGAPRGQQHTADQVSHRASPAAPSLVDRLTTADLATSWILVLGVLAPFLASPLAKKYLDRRRQTIDGMTTFAVAFIREFAQPLPRLHPEDRPLAVDLRCAPYRERLEILVAPAPGHSYPNLSDHRKNLVYDIERVLRVVPAQSFVCREPYEQGRWVVIPFQKNPVVPPQEGAT